MKAKNIPPSAVQAHAFRILPHEDLKQSIGKFVAAHNIKAGAMITAVGSLEEINLRYANRPSGIVQHGHFEIVSLVGTLGITGCHLHLSVSNEDGQTFGGHLLDGNLVYTTAEIVIASFPGIEFHRENDPAYGFRELVIRQEGDQGG